MTDVEDLAAAIREFEETLPGWWWKVGHCSWSRDASCGPDFRVATPDAALLRFPEVDEGFHVDLQDGTLADALRNVMGQALEARARYGVGLPEPASPGF